MAKLSVRSIGFPRNAGEETYLLKRVIELIIVDGKGDKAVPLEVVVLSVDRDKLTLSLQQFNGAAWKLTPSGNRWKKTEAQKSDSERFDLRMPASKSATQNSAQLPNVIAGVPSLIPPLPTVSGQPSETEMLATFIANIFEEAQNASGEIVLRSPDLPTIKNVQRTARYLVSLLSLILTLSLREEGAFTLADRKALYAEYLKEFEDLIEQPILAALGR